VAYPDKTLRPSSSAMLASKTEFAQANRPQWNNPEKDLTLEASGMEAAGMKNGKKNRKKSRTPKTRLRLPDLDQAKAAVLLSLRSPESQRGYRHAIDEFISWYCSEPRLSFNKTVVTRYKGFLEDRHLAAGTINVRLAAVRRLAYEATDAGLLSPELAAGIRRVKGSQKTRHSARELAHGR